MREKQTVKVKDVAGNEREVEIHGRTGDIEKKGVTQVGGQKRGPIETKSTKGV
jgi:hypothetical protein